MKGLLLSGPFDLDWVDVPDPRVRRRHVILQVRAASVCGSDLRAYQGIHPRIRAPTILGHEFAGIVAEVGSGSSGVTLGQRVCAEPNIRCGRCRYCLQGFSNVCINYRVLGEEPALPGALADYVLVPAENVHRLPDELSFDVAALVQPLSVAYHAVTDRGDVQPDEWVLIIGGGAIGLGTMLIAKSIGAKTILSDRHSFRRSLAKDLGCDVVVDADVQNLRTTVQELTNGYGVDVSFDAAGGKQESSWRQVTDLTANRGRIIVLGAFSLPSVPFDIVSFKYRELDIRGSQGHPSAFEPTLALIASGLPVARLISHRVQMHNLAGTFESLHHRTDDVMKVVAAPAN